MKKLILRNCFKGNSFTQILIRVTHKEIMLQPELIRTLTNINWGLQILRLTNQFLTRYILSTIWLSEQLLVNV